MMRINKIHIQVLVIEGIAIALLICITVTVAWVRTLPQAHRAQAFLSDFARLEVGTSTLDEAKSIAAKYNGVPGLVSDGSTRCTYENCEFQFLFENKPLTSTYLVPWVGLIGSVTVKDGVVVQKYLGFHRKSKRPIAYNVREMMVPPADTPDDREMRRHMLGFNRMHVDSKGVPWAVMVGLEPASNPDQKRRAYSLDTSCLSKFFGCSSPSAFFPRGVPYQGETSQTHAEEW